jgi:prepilin-type N-terminal cleavage/methylation domain-containing protein
MQCELRAGEINMRSRQGFTLLELSVVLAIIALVVGGVVTGMSLLGQGQVSRTIKDFERYRVALNDFAQKYDAYPGDMRDAATYWGADCLGGVGPNVCSGDGDGQVSCISGQYECIRGWQHLVRAGIISGNYDGTFTVTDTVVIGTDVPKSEFEGTGFNFGKIGSPSATAGVPRLNSVSIPAEDAKSIDLKMDDGIGNRGKMYGVGVACTGVASSDPVGADYVLGSGGRCVLRHYTQ